ncbi:hypothetical protein CDL15_Pgr017586 [Punica granatum]|uniref:Uncharacterized protein n=1 Tax=Punica granatum TaxID=22663 RepID=A0A218W695_PUNGR|nr:hypothetical protein CDL15_Pgr017586 [Punica granatum]
MGSDGGVMGSDRCKKEFEMCGGGSFLELGATKFWVLAAAWRLSRGLGLSCGLGLKPGTDPRHLLEDRVKRQATWFAWHWAWIASRAMTDDDSPMLAHLWTSVVW